jgi:hypothetical protein
MFSGHYLIKGLSSIEASRDFAMLLLAFVTSTGCFAFA